MYLALGAALGTVGGLFGIGGGLIAIPVLGVLFGLDQQIAQGTALVMVVPNVMLALWRYHQRNRIELRHALPLGVTGFALPGWGRSGRWGWMRAPCVSASLLFGRAIGLQPGAHVHSQRAAHRANALFLALAWRLGRGIRFHGRAVRGRRCGGRYAGTHQCLRHYSSGCPRLVVGLGVA